MTSLAAAANAGAGTAAIVVWLVLGVIFWLIPVIVAIVRGIPNTGSVVVIDLLLGWTLVGWVVALAMACRSHPRPQYLVPPDWRPPSN